MKNVKLNIQRFASTELSTGGITPQLTANFFNTSDYNLQLQENFIVVFPEIPGFGEGFELVAQSVTLPTRTTDEIPVNYANLQVKIAGRQSWSGANIVFRDVIKKDTELALESWMEAILSVKNGTRGSIEKYKINIEVIALDANGKKGRSNIIVGAFPTNINKGDMSYENTGIRTISVDLACDYCVRKEVLTGEINQQTFNG